MTLGAPVQRTLATPLVKVRLVMEGVFPDPAPKADSAPNRMATRANTLKPFLVSELLSNLMLHSQRTRRTNPKTLLTSAEDREPVTIMNLLILLLFCDEFELAQLMGFSP